MKVHNQCLGFCLFLFSPVAWGAVYNCTTEFGESVPLQISASRAGKADPDLSRTWNNSVRIDPSLSSRIKSKELSFGDEKIAVEWRYAKRAGPPFTIEVKCPAKGKCSGQFKNTADPNSLTIDTKLFDQRFASQRGYVQLELGDREELALRIRVFKEMNDPAGAVHQTLSASGEHMILSTEPRFIIDVGVDEHLKLSKNLEHRLAALEVKVRCKLA